jgi:hypothetical protein
MASYVIQEETLKAIADEVRDLTDVTDELNPNEMIANMEQANADVAAQTEIIEQIRTALEGKVLSNEDTLGAYFTKTLTHIKSTSLTELSAEGFFAEQVHLISVDLPNLFRPHDKLFYNCKKLTSVNLPKANYIGA